MKKRYSISQKKCRAGTVAFYGYVAEMCNIELQKRAHLIALGFVYRKPVQDS